MQTTLLTLLLTTSLASAALHSNGICYTSIGGQAVFNQEITNKACGNYLMRNTGGEWWDTCPDCKIITTGPLNHCNSADGHIGGDEWTYYCELNGGSPMTG
ncbi:hypothetical protein DM02DRAFT_584175 [Periconia macrospinosa]|uniref:Uncharacterized protein n=1 Tax=Periconia macrospinosa TaxID=97972 RepID=A0A2V1E8P2_9PLEO|nr:hypothetical protein DM02DRAFT_584175 [Periconia macrospinosa]